MKAKREALIRTGMLVSGALTGFLFITSLLTLKIYPPAFRWLAFGMLFFALVFFVLRTFNSYNETYTIKEKKKKA